MKNKKYLEFLFLIILGALTSLSLPPYNYLFVNFFTIGLFFIYIFKKKHSTKKNNSFLYGWFFGFGYFLTNLYIQIIIEYKTQTQQLANTQTHSLHGNKLCE